MVHSTSGRVELVKAPASPKMDNTKITPSGEITDASALIPPVINKIPPIMVLLTET